MSAGGEDVRFMRRALREARRGRTAPNPHVGAVVVRDGTIVAVGHHERAGADHAEVMALKRAGALARGATIYVSLEPCNHHGRTPPCTEAILAAQIARVVVGCADPAPHVAGSSRRLREAGVEVLVGVEEAKARALVDDFVKLLTRRLPYVLLKSAITLDGRVATRTGESKWITGPDSRRAVHRMRARADAILVGSGTALADDPALTVRDARGPSPRRVLLDSHLRVPPSARIFGPEGEEPLVYYGDDLRPAVHSARGLRVPVPRAEGGLDLESVLRDLGSRDVMRLMVEAGPRLAGQLLARGLVDELALFVAPKLLADAGARPMADGPARPHLADAIQLSTLSVRRYGDDVCFRGRLAEADERVLASGRR